MVFTAPITTELTFTELYYVIIPNFTIKSVEKYGNVRVALHVHLYIEYA
jgi:hypothetical protein